MTLAPSSDFGIRGVEGKRYDVNEMCSAPGCTQRAVHGHHLWARSLLGGAFDWVQTPDGLVIGNKVGLCIEHHGDVTGDVGGHRAKIRFEAGCFWWDDRIVVTRDLGNGKVEWDRQAVEWRTNGPLQFQPPGAIAAAPSAPSGSAVDTQEDLCPSCGKPKHSKPRKPLPARKTKDWTLTVPEDAEIGSDVLDGWAEDLAVVLGFGDLTSRLVRYHAVATGLAWVVQNREQFVADLQEASRA